MIVDADKVYDKATGGILKYNVAGKNNMILVGGFHTHDLINEEGKVNDSTTSLKDQETARSFGISNYAIDSWTGASENGNAIHRVTSSGVHTRNIGTTNNQNIGQDALNNYVDKQKK